MLDEEEYASSTDESDEDYNPNGNDSDGPASEIESDGEAEDFIPDETETKKTNKQKNRKRKASTSPIDSNDSIIKTRRSAAEPIKSPAQSKQNEKNDEKPLNTDDADDDENEDAIWASFLSKSAATAPPQIAKVTVDVATKSNESTKSKIEIVKPITTTIPPPAKTTESEKKKTEVVTEIFEFAGERVEVKKEVKIDTKKPDNDNKASTDDSKPSDSTSSAKGPKGRPPIRPGIGGGGGGLSSVLGQIGKKNKLSVLQKTALDWNGFKQNEGIDEELQTHNKGRDGYLERQDFLQRTDLRRFEIEKNMRQTTRRN